MANINYQSDFQVEVGLRGKNIVGVPFTLTFYTTTGDKTYVCEFDGSNYTNCKRIDDTTILVTFNNHELRPGQLKVKKEFHVANDSYPDGVQTIVDVEPLNINLVNGKADSVDTIKATLCQTFLKPVKGIDYFTPTEQLEFRQAIIDALKNDEELRLSVFNELKNDTEFFQGVVAFVETNITSDESFVNKIVEGVRNSGMKDEIKNDVLGIIQGDEAISFIVQKVRESM